jgi:hypothetical protein
VSRDPRAAIVSDQCDPPDPERLQELDDIVGHCPLVVAFGRLVGLAVSTQVRSYHPVMRGKRWNLETPSEAGLREAVQEDHWGTGPGFEVELADAVCPARSSTDGHRSRATGARFSKCHPPSSRSGLIASEVVVTIASLDM